MNLVDFLAPRICAFCGVWCEAGESSICAGCFADLPWREAALLPTPGIFERRVALLDYSFPVDAAIKAFKFRRKLYYAPAFAEILCQGLPLLPSGIEAVLPVPLHWRRKTWRGFNQAAEIAQPVAKRLGVPIARCVQRRKATPFQSGLDARERSGNLKQAFKVTRRATYSDILIVDDVVTTGATVESLAKVLLRHGVNRVSVLTLAQAGRD